MRKMHAFAFAGKCPLFGASGDWAAAASCERRLVKATLPMLAPIPYRNSRRVGFRVA
jgi:hypothetical protein